jgi:ABC-type nitrate/sulfonate/bicarbonate transport system ATPase subunit
MVMVTHDVEEAVFLSKTIMVLTRKEASIQAMIDMELPYPRDRESKEFLDYKSKIYKLLSEDASVSSQL